MNKELRTIRLIPVTRPKGKVRIQLSTTTNESGWKDRADWLLDALGVYYSHRAGYCLSPARAAIFERLYKAGVYANRQLMARRTEPPQFYLPGDDKLKAYTLKEILAVLDQAECAAQGELTSQLSRSKLITYKWRRAGDFEIKRAHIPALEESAEKRIVEMMAEGYTSGELKDYIHMTDDDPADGVEYSGWWDVSDAPVTQKQ